MGIVIDEERRHVIVINEEQHIRLLLRQPAPDGFVAFEDGSPVRVFFFMGIERKPDRGCMGAGDSADDLGHGLVLIK
jgi:hypothetical protein